jgi:putative NADH-flavin reductase
LKLVSFGATGGTGRHVVDRALAAGHQVVAMARKPEGVAPRPGLVVLKGDVLDLYAVKQAVAGADAVISTIGPAENGKPGTLISMGVNFMLQACKDEHVRRFVFESGMMVSDGKELSLIGSFAVAAFRMLYPKLYEEKVRAEQAIQLTKLEWVIVRPPALSQTPATGQYVVGPKARVSPASALSHADCAEVLVKAATENQWVNQIINVGRG